MCFGFLFSSNLYFWCRGLESVPNKHTFTSLYLSSTFRSLPLYIKSTPRKGLMDMWWKVGLVLVLCSGLTSSETREEHRDSSPRSMMLRMPVETLDFGFVPSVVYETHAYYEPGPIGVLFHMVHAFLYVVQPNPFPKGEMHTGFENAQKFSTFLRVYMWVSFTWQTSTYSYRSVL